MTRHDRTIQGYPWAPCSICPRRANLGGAGDEGVCPSRRNPHRCHQVASDPARYAPLVRAEPAEDRPGPVRRREARFEPVLLLPAQPLPPEAPRDAASLPGIVAVEPARPDWRYTHRLQVIARGCPYRAPCGCSRGWCYRDQREVDRYVDCAACVERGVFRALPAPLLRGDSGGD